ncbi:hypothetical protein ACLB2K_006380 [Fragaria x ananassa]
MIGREVLSEIAAQTSDRDLSGLLLHSNTVGGDPPKQQSPPKAAEPPMQPPRNAAESPNQSPPTAAESPMQHPKTPEPSKLKGRAKLRKCIAAFHSAKGTCLKEIYASYWHHRLNIGEDCCKAIREADDHCAETIFSHFKNPTYVRLLKEYCSIKQ